MRTKGSPAELERRRKAAVHAVLVEGLTPSIVAKAHGVHRVTVQKWLKAAQTPGGLDARPVIHPPALTDAQLPVLEQLLLQGPRAHGWDNDLWTAARVAEIIKRHFGIAYHPEHVRKILKRRLRWSSQKPQKKARQRDEDGIRRWKEVEFPRIVQQARERDAYLVFLDESGFQMMPVVRRTLAPRGQTPVFPCDYCRDKISAISAITLTPRRYLPDLKFRLLPAKENFNAARIVEFLQQLRREMPRFTVVWDRSRIHSRSKVVKAYLAKHPEIVAEDFPGYAPELNPDELVWCWTKYGRLCNWAAPDVGALRVRVESELETLRDQAYELLDFIDHTGLQLAA